jgi:hypothetical protein
VQPVDLPKWELADQKMHRTDGEVLVSYRITCIDQEQPEKNSVTNGRRVIMNARSWTMEIDCIISDYRLRGESNNTVT